jgi:two-component system, OmpR family, sensor histidine kinase KdpD
VARGRYRILLGMAAGVGKTYRMLQEGRQAQEEGRDVAIGYLEPHDHPQTSGLAEGLEVVPRLRVQHGTLELEDMDVDAVIRRAPELALIDELAHTNAPGMRNEKRYQDIEEILDAGIDVISTVNVQHLESLNDAIFELTETRVRETFPDRILDEADEVILVDLRPEALQDRLRAGKVYPLDRVDVAWSNFFRTGKLSALRELALREVAEDVESRRAHRSLEPLSQMAVAAVRRVAAERGSTYVFVGTPDESRRREIFGGSLLSRMVRELPGIDIRVVTNRTERDRLTP